MASAPPADSVENDDDFAKHFDEFAAGKAPDEANATEDEPEGNDPGEADEGADEAPGAAPDEDTSGEPAAGAEAPAEAPDPWASAPAELRSLYEAERKAREQAEHRARSDANRVAALSRKLAAQPASAPAPADTAETEAKNKALDEKRKQLEEDYPDVASPLFEIIDGLKDELGAVKQVVGSVEADRQAEVVADQQRALEAVHPDWRDIASDPRFGEWVQGQPQKIQELAGSWDARETSVALSLFKTEMGLAASQSQGNAAAAPAATARRSAQLEGGREVRSRPAPAASGAPDDFEAAFAHYAAKRDAKARR